MSKTMIIQCSGCNEEIDLDLAKGEVRAVRPSNGKRGSLHVPATPVASTVWFDEGDDFLAKWECPLCGYADSHCEYDD